MGRRPIVIPRHQPLRRRDQHQQQYYAHDANAGDSLLKADSLAHPLAFLDDEESPDDSFGSSSSRNRGCAGSIGIRRHGQKQQHRHQFSTPEKKNRTRLVRKRSPTSVLLPLEFIEEEGEEEEDQDPKTVKAKRPESVVSDIAVLGGLQGDREDGLSDSFFDENSIFGSIIEHVNESNDFGHDLVLPSDHAGFAPAPSSPPSSLEDQSTGTFGEMMLQQNHEMKYQQEREEMALRQQQEEDQMTSMLTTSSIHSTSTLERSLEVKKGQLFKIEHPYKNSRQNNSSNNGKKETTFQRLLKTATQCHQRSESRSTISSDNSTVKQRNSASVMRHQSPKTISSRNTLPLSPEEQRRIALAKYRLHQNMHTTKAKQTKVEPEPWNEFAMNSFHSDTMAQLQMDREPPIEPKGTTVEDDPHISMNSSALDDSFASIDDELRNLRNQTLRSNASFRLAESCLSNDFQESETLVRDLEEQLLAAKEQHDLCRERYELAKGKREKEKELTAIQTLHLEILDYSGKNERSRSMLVERHEHEMSSPSLARKRESGILGPILFTNQEQGGGSSARDDDSLGAEVGTDLASGAENSNLSYFEDRYVGKSIDDLRAIKNRLEAIKDLFDKARYMVSNEFSSSPAEMLRSQHQSQVMIETAASKYILFRIKNLI